MRTEVRVFKFNMRRLHGEGRVVMLVQLLAYRARTEARHIFGLGSGQSQYGTHAMGGVVHGRQSGPIVRPAVHVLLMAGFKELDFPQFTFFVRSEEHTSE